MFLRSTAVRACALAVSALAVSLAPLSSPAAPAKAGLASGRITYRFQSPMASGTSVLCWTDGGKRFRQEMRGGSTGNRQMTMMESWTIGDGTYLYIYQPQMGKAVMRAKMPKAGAAGSGMPLLSTDKKAGKVIGKGKILGKTCEIRQVNGAKIWTWNGLALKMENKGSAQSPAMTMEATKLEPGVKLPASLFKIPGGYRVQDFQLPPASAAR
jgi:hypothetical protein